MWTCQLWRNIWRRNASTKGLVRLSSALCQEKDIERKHFVTRLSDSLVLIFLPAVCFQQCCSQMLWIRIRTYVLDLSDSDLPSTSKNSKKNLDFYYFVRLFDYFYVNVTSKSNKQKTLKQIFFCILKVPDEKSRIRIRTKMFRIHNTGCSFDFW
jgi:hypothetical protein